ncbi:MAG: hypothetical protein HN929_02485 [Chloroflexi bacterium]|nr:hypothetical protein [Chloroflexota bacterium]MBT7080328.1 hypothetical protein [Chloroflexota bacterium]MBT7289373.1 hypothetical protein [Chloroflexota bacterium]
MAPLQKRAWYSLVIGIVFAIALVAVFVASGDVTTFDENLGLRLAVYALWVGTPLTYLIIMNPVIRKSKQVDERDKLILERAPRVQYLAILFSLVAWVIALTEVFGDKGVPVIYLTLILISTLVISTIAQSAGILIGYWRMGHVNGQE